MKVALITSWGERCGIAEYAANLISNCPDIEFDIISRQMPMQLSLDMIQRCDVVQLNYEPGILGHWNKEIIRRLGKPSILTLHTSHEGNNRDEFTNSFSRVVVHEKTTDGFTFTPMGIPVHNSIETSPIKFDVGTFGFPFPWKGFSEVVQACHLLDIHCLVIAPESRHAETKVMKDYLLTLHDKVTYISDWLSQDAVITLLKSCKINAFLYHGGNYGISAACRLGLATGSKMVLTRNRQFRDLYEYEDEIQFVSNPPNVDEVANVFRHMLSDRIETKPRRVMKDYSWERVGQMYKSLYEELLNG